MGKKTYSLIFMLFAVIVCAGFLNSAAAAAQQVTTQQVATQQSTKAKNTATRLTYSVYAGGVYVLAATLDISQKSGSYGLDLRAQTLGILGNLAPWSGEFKTRGVSQKAPLPLTYRSASVWKGETEAKTYRYDGAGHFKSYRGRGSLKHAEFHKKRHFHLPIARPRSGKGKLRPKPIVMTVRDILNPIR